MADCVAYHQIIKLGLCQIVLLHLVFAEQKCSPWAVPINNSAFGQRCICNYYPEVATLNDYFSCTKRTLDIGVCLTQDSDDDSAVYGKCPYVIKIDGNLTLVRSHASLFFRKARTVQTQELDRLMCGSLNRHDLLCSKCKPGYGPAVYAFGFMCADCDEHFSGWGLYLFLQLFPLTVFYAIVIIFHVQAASPPFISFVLLCQAYLQTERSSVFVRIHIEKFAHPILIKIAQTLCGFWNLDFFRHIIPPFCVDSRLNNLHALWLDFITAYYPLLLIFITYVAIELHARNFKPIVVLWRPFHKFCVRIRRGLDPKSSIINAFATFLVLSIGKIIFLSAHSVYTTRINAIYGNVSDYRKALYYEPRLLADNVQYLYVIPVVNMFLFAILPAIFLCLYPTRIFRKVLKCFRMDGSSLLTFLDVFQGHFKDGTSGTRDYRAISGVYIILEVYRALVYTKSVLQSGVPTSSDIFLLTVLILTVVLFAVSHPYKRKWDNYLTVINFILMYFVLAGFTIILTAQNDTHTSQTVIFVNIVLLLPHIALYGYAMHKIANNLGITRHLKNSAMVQISTIKFMKMLHHINLSRHADYERVQGMNYEEFMPDRLKNPQYYNRRAQNQSSQKQCV